MDIKDNYQGEPGGLRKASQLSAHEVTEAELKAINKYTTEPLKAEDVFVFKAVLCDNEVDRDFDHFTVKALQDLQRLFLGKTVIKDHTYRADNQVARIYGTELVQGSKVTKQGEIYTQLVAHCYMLNKASNEDLIADIKGGIKKEGSVGFRPSSAICSICGTDNAKTYCRHWAGKEYDKEGGKALCTFKLDGCSDAYEFSLVAVPAQRAAGVSKSYNGGVMYDPGDEPEDQGPADTKGKEQEQELNLRARIGRALASHRD